MLFKTTSDQVLNLYTMSLEMKDHGIDQSFIDEIIRLAAFDQGIYDLVEMWYFSHSVSERELIMHDIESCVSDYLKYS